MKALLKTLTNNNTRYFLVEDCTSLEVVESLFYIPKSLEEYIKDDCYDDEEDETDIDDELSEAIYDQDLDFEEITYGEYDNYLEEYDDLIISEISLLREDGCCYIKSNFLAYCGEDTDSEFEEGHCKEIIYNFDEDYWYSSYKDYISVYKEIIVNEFSKWYDKEEGFWIYLKQ